MSDKFRVALSGDFHKADGSPVFPDFDLAPLREAKDVEVASLESVSALRAEQLEDFDALILLGHRFDANSVPASRRLAAVARFGVGYDTVDVPACTASGIALVITPDGVRRPVAVSIITFMLALTGRIMVKDRLARLGPPGFAARGDHMGVGLVGKTLGSIGVGNIGAEMFRLAKAFDMKFLAHDPFADPRAVAELGIELTSLDDVFSRSDILTVNCPLMPETHHLVNAERLARMKRTAFFINTARGPIVDQKALTQRSAGWPDRRRRPRCVRAGANRSRRSSAQTRQCHSGAACLVLDRPVFCRQWRRRHQGSARYSARPRATGSCQPGCA